MRPVTPTTCYWPLWTTTSRRPTGRRCEIVTKGDLAVFIQVDDLDKTFESLRAAGTEILQEPVDQPYGVRDAAVRDPSGNHLRLSQPRWANPLNRTPLKPSLLTHRFSSAAPTSGSCMATLANPPKRSGCALIWLARKSLHAVAASWASFASRMRRSQGQRAS
jgi:Glyoxalase/Bleomycin resistance protein/Dioxygenase superfamily